ncbi:MAG: hypothetical protein IPK26_30770 [Planctomycetes bacterium]|nr:hypothetical protein [Planctomycetota bacterium]
MSDESNVCFFGVPAMGSWKVRADQIATMRARWHATGSLEPHDILTHDVFCAVKRPFRNRLRLLQAMGKLCVYDVVDCWQQPQDGLDHADAPAVRRFFEKFFADLPVDSVIFPNRTMHDDLGDLVPNPTFIYHHFWPGMEPIEVREQARIVGYQGAPNYLGEWRPIVERACRRLGLEFVVNPVDFRSIDIGFAARGGVHASLMSHRYKSNVKLANFYGAAMPCLVNDEELAYHETDNGEVRFYRTAEELEQRLAELVDHDTRLRIHQKFLTTRKEYTLEAIAGQYEAWFARLRRLVPVREVGQPGCYPVRPS